ncbi:MAG TPA: hypothetical protein VMW65_16200 [Chloroflexota bacterium]|nr:hypothetical protein [Chloroflexota bacterium]
MRDIEERRAIEAIRSFFESVAPAQRAVTAEWLAGRLGLPTVVCHAALSRLVDARIVRRVSRSKNTPVFMRRDPSQRSLGGHLLVALLALTTVTVAFFVALNSRYVFIAGEALAVGLIIAFAWLDAELHDARPPDPPT